MPADPPDTSPSVTPGPLSDEELETLLERLYPKLRAILGRYRVPFDDADDVLQDALLLLVRKGSVLRNPEAYLLTTVQYRCRMYWRSRSRSRRRIEQVEQELLEEVAAPGPGPQQLVGQRLDLQRCLAQLPASTRRLVRLRYALGYTARELAPLLGAPPDAVRQRSVYARRRFFDRLMQADLL